MKTWVVLACGAGLSVLAGACGSRGVCAPGEHEACLCAGGRSGARACDARGRFSPCVCTALVASPPSAPPPSTVPLPLPAPPPPSPLPGTTTARPEELVAAWVRGPLEGRDNDMAHLRAVTITPRADGGYAISIRNQFRWTCALEFDAGGHPAVLRHCTSAEPGWYADPSEIHFTCATAETAETCDAPYTLGERSAHMRDAAKFRIIRRFRSLAEPTTAPAPPPPRPPRSRGLRQILLI